MLAPTASRSLFLFGRLTALIGGGLLFVAGGLVHPLTAAASSGPVLVEPGNQLRVDAVAQSMQKVLSGQSSLQVIRAQMEESQIPANASVRFLPLWKDRHTFILFVMAAFFMEAALITVLVAERLRRRRAERSLHQSEECMSLAADAANLGMWIWDVRRKEIWMTDKGRELLGFAPGEQLDFAALAGRVHPEDRAARETAIRDALDTKGEYAMEYRVLLPDGKMRWIGARGHALNHGAKKGSGLLGISLDITAQKQAEAEARQYREELTHLSRIEILGEMAASLAHELNQPLTGIMNNASAGRRFIAKGRADMPKLVGLFESIIADARRAGEVIRGIRGLVRKGEVARGPVNLNSIIADVVLFVRSEALERHCVIITDQDPKLPIVIANPVLLQQVLINILVNAFDAMGDTPLEDRRVIIRTNGETAGKAEVSVRDFGTGLPMDNPQRIFQNFFSTKREGLGVGLAIAQSIITSHGGELGAKNAEGGGASIYFSLPAISESALVTKEEIAA